MLLRTLKLGPVPLDFLTRLALADALEQQPNHILKKRELATSSHPSATRGGFSGSATQQPSMCVWVAVGWLISNSHPGWLLGG